MKNYILIILIFTLFSSKGSTIDSLIAELPYKTDTNKLDLLLNIVNKTMYPDPLKSMDFAEKGFKIADSLHYRKRLTLFSNSIGILYNEMGNYTKARHYFKISLKQSVLRSDSINIAKSYGNIGNSYLYATEYDKSIEFYIKSLKIFKQLKIVVGEAQIYGVLGNLYLKTQEYDKSLKYYAKAGVLFEKLGFKEGLATTYMNSGIIYRKYKKDYEKATELYTKTLKIYKNINYRKGIALCNANIGEVFFNKKEYRRAIIEQSKASKIFNEINAYEQAGASLLNIGNSYYELRKFNIALDYYLNSYEVAKANNLLSSIEKSSFKLSEMYKLHNNYIKANKFLTIYIEAHDSLYNIEKENNYQKLLSGFETEQKEKEIEILTKTKELNKVQLEKNEVQLKQQKIIIISVILGIISVIIFIILVLKQNKQKRRANIKLTEQNEEINQQKEEIITQRDEIESQRDNVQEQKQLIENIHNDISQSIDYAMKIQQSILPEENILKKYLSNYFVFFKPKDKVSGDFYWWTHIDDYTIITAADCTGHGVPGAFMSMLGMSFLREIVLKEKIIDTGVILNKLRIEIIKALKQTNEIGGQKDGMDMSIITINHKTNTIQFSGANNPLYIVANNKLEIESDIVKLFDSSELEHQSSKLLYELKPNKMPISVFQQMKDFSSHEIKLQKGDQLYMFSDGYADQFGGVKGKKFKYKPFKKLLIANSGKSMQKQKIELEKTFIKWKANYDQIDDVVVLGIEL